MDFRKEHDSMGEVLVPSDKYWGAQAQRVLQQLRLCWVSGVFTTASGCANQMGEPRPRHRATLGRRARAGLPSRSASPPSLWLCPQRGSCRLV